MIKVAMIGAGSVVFSKNLTADILSYPEFKNATFSYMDIDEERLEVGANLCRKVAKTMDANPTIQATSNRRQALQGADFVINMVQIGGFDSTLVDFEIPRKYGLNFTIADTTGPGGLFRALRTYSMIKGLCEDMTEICPKAVLLNYSNPMSMNMQTVFRTSDIQAVGLCHSVQSSLKRILRHLGEEPEGVVFQCAGINHMSFYTRLEKNGEDLYPRLFDAMTELEAKGTRHVRMELMKRLGYFVTESSEHHAEYSSFFIAPGAQAIDKFHVPIDEYLRRCNGIVDEFERMKTFSVSDEPMEVHRSHEYGSTIIHSIATGQPSVVYGNMPNNGAISNLPATAIVEVPTLVDSAGLQFTTYGELPPELVGYMQPHITQHELFIRAALEGRRDHVYQACFYDPLTAATLTTDKIVEMCDELIAAHGDVLPDLDRKKTRVPGSGKTFAPPTPQELRASWDAAQHKARVENIESWSVIGPFPARDSTPVEEAFLAYGDGSIDLNAAYASTQNASEALNWKLVPTQNEAVDLSDSAPMDSVAYAYAEIASVHARDAVIKCNSEGNLKIWLNGQVVHETNTPSSAPVSDLVTVHLSEGKNRFFLKTERLGPAWSFGLAIPQANF
jgi:alpha-galactosidase